MRRSRTTTSWPRWSRPPPRANPTARAYENQAPKPAPAGRDAGTNERKRYECDHGSEATARSRRTSRRFPQPRSGVSEQGVCRAASVTSRRRRARRQKMADEARGEARSRIARAGEPACVADALAALGHGGAAPWGAAREQLQQAIETGRVEDVGAVARRTLWAISRDAARSSRRARRDPELALAACVAYAIIARLPRTAMRSAQRSDPGPRRRVRSPHAFWR